MVVTGVVSEARPTEGLKIGLTRRLLLVSELPNIFISECKKDMFFSKDQGS